MSINSSADAGPALAVRLGRPTFIQTPVGCAKDSSAAGLRDFFAQALGPLKGHDEPRTTLLPDGRTLWLLQDPFIDYKGDTDAFTGMDYTSNAALIQTGLCFTMLEGGTSTRAEPFEVGDAPADFTRFFWPGGATVSGNQLSVFWIEIHRDLEGLGPLDGLGAHPVATWIATYDLPTLTRVGFRSAPDSGVSPVYGFGVADDGTWTYLFGNSDLQNLALEGGYGSGTHSATKMYLARVPRGQVMTPPDYWNGSGWSPTAADAVPISNRFYTENLMLPTLINDRWYSATKVDGFTGSEVVVDVADYPWGPYTTLRTLPATPRGDPSGVVTYHAAVLPWLDPTGGLIVTLSQIPADMSQRSAVPRYRPNFFLVPL